ncbi:MAG TPA: BON domain-containing protein [Terriglobales bacterium]|nr:BON domain-containing protein [Terriglobales bacterium]
MLLCHLLLGFLWLGQTPKVHTSHPHATAKVAAKAPAAAPKGPKTRAQLEQDLEAALHAAPFTGDQVNLSVSGTGITISGKVHWAENKGVATREARRVAAKDGWGGLHVFNHMDVVLLAQD